MQVENYYILHRLFSVGTPGLQLAQGCFCFCRRVAGFGLTIKGVRRFQ